MKYTKLSVRFNNLVSSEKKGKPIDQDKLAKLIKRLRSKRSDYEKKIVNSNDTEKRKVFETRLKVVKAQLEKAKEIESASTSGAE